MLQFEIAKRNPYCPDVLDGVIAYDNGLRYCDTEWQLNDSWERVRQESPSSTIALFIDEKDALFEIATIREMQAAERFSGVVTFGVHDDNDGTTQPVGTSHFDIISNELKFPFLQLVRPPEFNEPSTWEEWIFNNPLKSLYYQHVEIVLGKDSAVVAPRKN